jgi:serine protease Do
MKFTSERWCMKMGLGILLMAGWVCQAWAGPAQPLTAAEKEQAAQMNAVVRRAVEQALPAVVSIQVSKKMEKGMMNPFMPEDMEVEGIGSGVIIDKKGYVITNNHVVAETDKVTVVLADGRSFEAKGKFLDPDTDLAIVQIDPKDQDLPVAALGDSDKVEVGNMVFAMGSPFGFTQTVTSGIISFKGRRTGILNPYWGYEDFIQTNADISKGNSGGPLVDLYGEVIGINSNILSQTGISSGYGFAVPSNLAKFVSDQLIAHGQVKRGWLGISMNGLAELRKLPPDIRKEVLSEHSEILEGIPDTLEGVLVINVNKGGPSDQAGIKSRDVILDINGTKTTQSNALRNYIATLPPGTTAHCTIWRDGGEMPIDVNLGDRDVAKAKEPEPGKIHARRGPSEGPGVPTEQKGKLGIAPKELTAELAKKYGVPEDTQGVLIENVITGSLAELCGLKAGDVILSADGEKVTTISQLRKIIIQADLEQKGLEVEILNAQGRTRLLIKQSQNL